MSLPKDNFILLSYVNTKLRDCYSSLEEFCEEEGASRDEVCCRLAEAGYEYSEELNSFI